MEYSARENAVSLLGALQYRRRCAASAPNRLRLSNAARKVSRHRCGLLSRKRMEYSAREKARE
jgi:hypothetical protein